MFRFSIRLTLVLVYLLPLRAADPRIAPWVQSLASADRRAQLKAGYSLQPARRQDEESLVRDLLPLTSDPHEEVRAYAASLLGEHRALEPQTIPALIKLLSDPMPKVREHAAIALAQIGPPAVPLLLQSLAKAKPSSGAFASPRRELKDAPDYAYAALFEIGPVILPRVLSGFHTLGSGGEGYLAAVLRTLAAEDPELFLKRVMGAPVFSRAEVQELFDPSLLPAVPALLKKLHEPSVPDQKFSAFALASLNLAVVGSAPDKAIEPSGPVPVAFTRRRFDSTLWSGERSQLTDNDNAIAYFTLAIADPQNPWQTRAQMAPALRDLAGSADSAKRQAIGRALAGVLENTLDAWPLREAAALALEHGNMTASIPVVTLRGVLRSASTPWPVATVAAQLAGQMGAGASPSVGELQTLASSSPSLTLRLAATRALGHMDKPGMDSLEKLTHAANEETRIVAVFGVAEDRESGRALLQEALQSSSPRVRTAAIAAGARQSPSIRAIPVAEARPFTPLPMAVEAPVIRIYATGPTQRLESDLQVGRNEEKLGAANALAERGPEGVRILARAVAGTDRNAARAAIAALSGGGKDAALAVPQLCDALLDQNLQAGAAHALWVIGGYSEECEQMITTVLKDQLIQEYISNDLESEPGISAWSNPKLLAVPDVPKDPLTIEELLNPPRIEVLEEVLAPLISATQEEALPALTLPQPSIWTTIDLTMAPGKNVYDAYTRILNAMDGYNAFGIFAAPAGFTLVTRVEQIDPNWKPLPGEYRWRSGRPGVSPFSLSSFFREMLFAPPGKFRMIAFMVTTQLIPAFSGEPWTEDQARTKFTEGAKILPESFRGVAYAGHYCHVLIYNYDKPLGKLARIQPPSAGVADVRTQLIGSGIWNKLRTP